MTPFDLRAALPLLLPAAVAWAEARSQEAAAKGKALDARAISLAKSAGVRHPELIRILIVDSLPLPEQPNLRVAAQQIGLLGPGMIGLTLGYSVFICRGHESSRLLSHEFRHVYQYEVNGSIAGFLPLYLQQIVEFGYFDAPFEVDARRQES